MPELDPALLELLRESSGLSIDLDGRFLHRGEPITHERTLQVLWGSLERNERGRYQVRVGREIGYVAIADAPYGVRGVSWDHAGAPEDSSGRGTAADTKVPTAHLSDGSVEPLSPETLTIDADGVLHCRVKHGLHRARFSRAAQVTLGLALSENPLVPGTYRLQLGARSFPVVPE